MPPNPSAVPLPDPDDLLHAAARGDMAAVGKLLDLHRERLRRAVAFRLDAHLTAHVDASDIVQDALIDAVRKLSDYVQRRPLPFYPWLHRLAIERLQQARRRFRREPEPMAWPDSSAELLAQRFVADDPSPGRVLVLEEERRRIRDALDLLSHLDREVLMMRFLEDLTFAEIAGILGIELGTAKMRAHRAIRRIGEIVKKDESEP